MLVENPHNQSEQSSETETSGTRFDFLGLMSSLKLRLSTRLILALIAIQALMLVAITWNSVRLINSSHQELLETAIELETKLLSNSLAPGLAANDRAIVEDVLALLTENSHYVYIVVFNNKGEVMAKIGEPHDHAPHASYKEALDEGVFDVANNITLVG